MGVISFCWHRFARLRCYCSENLVQTSRYYGGSVLSVVKGSTLMWPCDVCYVTTNLLCVCLTQGSWPRLSMRSEDVTCPWWTLNLQPDEPPTTSGELQHMYNQNPESLVEYPTTNSLSLSAGKQTLTSPVLPQFVFTLMTWWVLPNTHTHTHR